MSEVPDPLPHHKCLTVTTILFQILGRKEEKGDNFILQKSLVIKNPYTDQFSY